MLDTADTLALAQAHLFKNFDADEAAVGQLLYELLRRGATTADLYLQHTVTHEWRYEEGRVKSGHYGIDRGFGLRNVRDVRQTLAYGDRLTLAALRQARDAVAFGPDRAHDACVPVFSGINPPRRYRPIDAGAANPQAELVLLAKVDRICRLLDRRVQNVILSLHAETDVFALFTGEGLKAGDWRPQVQLNLRVVLGDGDRREEGLSGGGARAGLELFTDERLETWCREAVMQAATALSAAPAPAGVMPVVLGPGWSGILIHEAVGHGLEADGVRKGTSAFGGRLGERVAAECVTVVDDATLPNGRGSLTVDDEGVPGARTVLIENGILKAFMTDRIHAAALGLPLTGNGRRESFASLPLPRMTNTFLAPGPHLPQDIIASVEDGVYAQSFSSGQVDVASGNFVFIMSGARRIRKGRLAEPLRGATLTGNGLRALHDIPMIGNDFAMDPGIGQCGKEGQHCAVAVGMPTIRIDALTVGGRA